MQKKPKLPKTNKELDRIKSDTHCQGFVDGQNSKAPDIRSLHEKIKSMEQQLRNDEQNQRRRNTSLQVLQSIATSNEAIARALGDIIEPRRV